MSLLQLIKDDALTARKARDKETSSILLLLIGECERIAKDATDEQVESIGRKMIKSLDSVIQLEPLSIQARQERTVLIKYFPEIVIPTLSEAIAQVKQENPDKELTDKTVGWFVGKVMKLGQGTYDIQLVKATLQQ